MEEKKQFVWIIIIEYSNNMEYNNNNNINKLDI